MCARRNSSSFYAMNTYHLEYAHMFVRSDRVASDQDFHLLLQAHTSDALLTEFREDAE